MRKAIFLKFIKVLLAALLLNSVIFYIVTSSVLLKNSRSDMLYTLEILDHSLDYTGRLEEEVRRLDPVFGKNGSRLTIIRTDGSVAADSGVTDSHMLDNHLLREEVSEAIEFGSGNSKRYSDTLRESMLYVAIHSEHSPYVLRLAMPYYGPREYLTMLFPAICLSFAVALFVSSGVADRFAASVSKPLHEISMEMLKVHEDYGNLKFEECPYEEINIIAKTTTKMEENVRKYLERIEMEKQIRQEFFSNASHELKTPITSIQGYAELIESGMIEDENTKLDFIQRIKKEAGNMAGLINDILMISKLETKEAKVEKQEVRIALILEDIVESLGPLAASQNVLVHIDCKPLSIYANAQQLTELCSNLISNAIKYNQPGGQVWVRVTEEDRNMVISVKDNGMGISEEFIPRIFERFYRVDKGRSKKQGGTGLGLSIVKHIVNFYHGSITVNSKLDMGTEFLIRLPMNR